MEKLSSSLVGTIRKIPFLAGLTPVQLSALLRLCKQTSYKAGEVLCKADEPSRELSILPSDVICVAIAREGDVFLDPMCAPPMRLGRLEEGRQALEQRASQLPEPPSAELHDWTAHLCEDQEHKLHPSGHSVRYKAMAAMLIAEKGSLPDDGALDFCGHF